MAFRNQADGVFSYRASSIQASTRGIGSFRLAAPIGVKVSIQRGSAYRSADAVHPMTAHSRSGCIESLGPVVVSMSIGHRLGRAVPGLVEVPSLLAGCSERPFLRCSAASTDRLWPIQALKVTLVTLRDPSAFLPAKSSTASQSPSRGPWSLPIGSGSLAFRLWSSAHGLHTHLASCIFDQGRLDPAFCFLLCSLFARSGAYFRRHCCSSADRTADNAEGWILFRCPSRRDSVLSPRSSFSSGRGLVVHRQPGTSQGPDGEVPKAALGL